MPFLAEIGLTDLPKSRGAGGNGTPGTHDSDRPIAVHNRVLKAGLLGCGTHTVSIRI